MKAEKKEQKEKKPMSVGKKILIGVGVFFLLIMMFGGESSETEGSKENEKTGTTTTVEKFSLLDGHSGAAKSAYSYEISGTIKNNKDKEYSYVQIEFYTYDADGNMLDTCLANNSGLEANGTWKFTASCFFGDENANQVASYKLKEITGW